MVFTVIMRQTIIYINISIIIIDNCIDYTIVDEFYKKYMEM